MLKAGNKIGMTKNTFSDVFKSRFGREKKGSLFNLYPITASTMNVPSNEIKRGMVANGVSYPILSDKVFINNPKNIKNEMLSPQDKMNFSKKSILVNFNIRRINSPGKSVRKRNPMIGLRIGISKSIVKLAKEIINSIIRKLNPLLKLSLIVSMTQPTFFSIIWTV